MEARLTGGEGKLRQHTVGIRELGNVLTAVPRKLNGLYAAAASAHKARANGVALHAGLDAVAIIHDSAIQRVIGRNQRQDRVIAAGAHMVKVRIALAHNRFPNEQLGSKGVGQLIRIGIVLRSPRGGKVALIAILHDTPQQQLNIVRLDGVVVLAGIVIPKILTEAVVGIADISGEAGLDAIAYLPVKGIHTVQGGVVAGACCPAVHVGFRGVSPCVLGVNLSSVPVTGERNHIGLHCFACGEDRGRAKARKHGECHEDCKQLRHSSFENLLHSFCPPSRHEKSTVSLRRSFRCIDLFILMPTQMLIFSLWFGFSSLIIDSMTSLFSFPS